MKKQIIITALLGMAAAGFLALGNAWAGEPASAPGEEIVIDGKKPARFSHPVHLNLGLECAACHHDREHNPLDAEAIGTITDPGGVKCVVCHNSEHPNPELRTPKDVFHARCKSCHEQGFAGKNGPTKCTDCHLKKGAKGYEGC